MASTVAKAKRIEAAMTALRAECARLAALFDAEPANFAVLSKDPETAQAQVLEEVGAFLGRIGDTTATLLRTAEEWRATQGVVLPEPAPEPEPVNPRRGKR